MGSYYAKRLSGERLRECYRIAPPRIAQYLAAELEHAASRIRPGDALLDLGCGYGRVLEQLADRAAQVTGIDNSADSLRLAHRLLGGASSIRLLQMDAAALAFGDRTFDLTLCLQNGISAFGVDQRNLLSEAIRVTRGGGRVLFSSYAARFWKERLSWFELQSARGLVGEIDWEATADGVIVCRDGFRATTVGPDEFVALTASLGVTCQVQEIDGSSLFCELALA